MVAKVRERLAVCKQATQEVVGERFNLRKLNELEVRKRYPIEITNRFAALGNVENDGDINRTWEDIKEGIKSSAKGSLGVQDQKKYKPWFDEECLDLLDRRKQAKMQWMQDPSQSNGENLNKVRREASRHFRNKKEGIFES